MRTLIVPAGGTPQENGERLWEALDAAASVASNSNPYVLQLDPGSYVYSRPTGSQFEVAPGISIRGGGMNNTFVSSLLYKAPGQTSLVGSFGLSDLTVGAYAGVSIASINIQAVTLDHVHFQGTTVLEASVPNASVLITNSIFDVVVGIYDTTHDTTDRFRIVGSQLPGVVSSNVPGTLACFSSYTADLAPLNNACQ